MARASTLTKPASQELLHLTVVRTERLSPHWMRVTLGGGDINNFVYLGFDQWFRLFLPVSGEAGLQRIPAKANKLFGYLKFLRIPEGERPLMRAYSVRAYRPATDAAGAELDVDFVLHGSAADGTAGPASRWAARAEVGESVVIIDEGIAFANTDAREVVLVADETGLPAIASICASLPADARGVVIIEAPSADDVLPFDAPAGIDVRWIVRDAHERPGVAVLAAVQALDAPVSAATHHFIVGEQALPTGARRHLVARGVAKSAISFVGYWRHGVAEAATAAQRAAVN